MELLIATIIAALILWLGSEPETLRDQSERLGKGGTGWRKDRSS